MLADKEHFTVQCINCSLSLFTSSSELGYFWKTSFFSISPKLQLKNFNPELHLRRVGKLCISINRPSSLKLGRIRRFTLQPHFAET